jgi:hypothetical protein
MPLMLYDPPFDLVHNDIPFRMPTRNSQSFCFAGIAQTMVESLALWHSCCRFYLALPPSVFEDVAKMVRQCCALCPSQEGEKSNNFFSEMNMFFLMFKFGIKLATLFQLVCPNLVFLWAYLATLICTYQPIAHTNLHKATCLYKK